MILKCSALYDMNGTLFRGLAHAYSTVIYPLGGKFPTAMQYRPLDSWNHACPALYGSTLHIHSARASIICCFLGLLHVGIDQPAYGNCVSLRVYKARGSCEAGRREKRRLLPARFSFTPCASDCSPSDIPAYHISHAKRSPIGSAQQCKMEQEVQRCRLYPPANTKSRQGKRKQMAPFAMAARCDSISLRSRSG